MRSLTSEVLKKYLKAGKVAKNALLKGREICDVGVEYFEVVEGIEEIIEKNGAKPAFPINISVNDIGAHYSPYPDDGSEFKKGDLVKIDVGCHIDGYIADNALTVELGTNRYGDLIKASEEALSLALKTIRPGVKTKDIGRNIESAIKNRGFRPIKNLTGHAVEKYELHSGLSIPNVPKGRDKIKKGMVLAIEPFSTDGKGKVTDREKSEIYRLRGSGRLKGEDLDFYEWIEDNFDHLPFASYWCDRYSSDYKKRLTRLERLGSVMSYPILAEERGGMISQREHTAIVTSNGVKVTTR